MQAFLTSPMQDREFKGKYLKRQPLVVYIIMWDAGSVGRGWVPLKVAPLALPHGGWVPPKVTPRYNQGCRFAKIHAPGVLVVKMQSSAKG